MGTVHSEPGFPNSLDIKLVATAVVHIFGISGTKAELCHSILNPGQALGTLHRSCRHLKVGKKLESKDTGVLKETITENFYPYVFITIHYNVILYFFLECQI